MCNPFRYFNSSPEVIHLVVMMYIRYPLSLGQVEEILFERRIDICHETVRFWWNRFGPMFAAEIRKRRLHHRSYRSAMKQIGNAAHQECGRWHNNRAENSHQPFRRRERAMQKFRDGKILQKFASIHNHFNHDRYVNRRGIFKQNRAAALAEWRQLAA